MPTHATQQITATLHALLPSYTPRTSDTSIDGLPSRLVRLAQSLLQRSRSRAPRLRDGTEEAARVWVVAELACHALKGRLDLPHIERRPPCAPKTYGRLYGYLEGVLGGDEGSGDARGARGKEKALGASAMSTPTKATPVKRASGAGVATPEGSARRVKKRKVMHSDTVGFQEMAQQEDATLEESGDATMSDAIDKPMSAGIHQLYSPDSDNGNCVEDTEQANGAFDGSEAPLVGDTDTGTGIGRGCLMEKRFDWLTDERKRDFETWKADILLRIEEQEQAQQQKSANRPSKGKDGVFLSNPKSLSVRMSRAKVSGAA